MSFVRNPVDSLSALVLSLTTGLAGEDPWRAFLVQLAEQAGAAHAALVLLPTDEDARATIFAPTCRYAALQKDQQARMQLDPLVSLPEGKLVALYEYVGANAPGASSDFSDWLEGIEASHILAADLQSQHGLIAQLRLMRVPGAAPFDATECLLVEHVLPHLRQALEIYQQLELARSEQAVMIDAVQQFAVGTVLLDHDLKILKMNAVAASILGEQDGIRISGGRLRLDALAADKTFQGLLEKARHADVENFRHILPVARPSGKRDAAIVIRPVSLPNFMTAGPAPAVALFITDPARHRAVDGETVCRMLPLTPAEGAISAALANGASLAEAARQFAITENTVRVHLRSIFAKTGINRQSQLVHLIHSGFPEAYASV